MRPVDLAVPEQPPLEVPAERARVRVGVQRLVPEVVDVVGPREVAHPLGHTVPPRHQGRTVADDPVMEQPPIEPVALVVGHEVRVGEDAGHQPAEQQALRHDGPAPGLALVAVAQVAAIELSPL